MAPALPLRRPAPLPIALLLALALAGCELPSTASVPLAYEPTGPAQVPRSRPLVAVGPVIDARGAPADRVGTARGNPGFPEEALQSEPPVPQAVRAAFTSALMARGLLAPPGRSRFGLGVRVVRLEAGQGWQRHAAAEFAVTLTRGDTGRVVYARDVRADLRASARPFSLDTTAYVPFADIADFTESAMNRAIKQALDDPGFLAAVHG